MNLENISFREIHFGMPEYAESLVLRDLVLREPLGLEFYAEDIATEYTSIHLGVFNHTFLIGVLVIKPIDESSAKVRQVAMHPDYQNQGLGSKLSTTAESVCKQRGYTFIELHARKTAVEFYKKQGYDIEGSEFEEVGIPHYKMTKHLS